MPVYELLARPMADGMCSSRQLCVSLSVMYYHAIIVVCLRHRVFAIRLEFRCLEIGVEYGLDHWWRYVCLA